MWEVLCGRHRRVRFYDPTSSDILSPMIAVDITGDSNHTQVTRFAGFSVRESAGSPAAAAVNFRDSAVGGQILAVLELGADESASFNLDDVLPVDTGVYVEVVSGTISGVLYGR